MTSLAALTLASQKSLRRLVARLALAGLGAAFGAVGLGFATWALLATLRSQYGLADAAAGIAAIYVVVAAGLIAWRASLASTRARHRPVESVAERAAVADTLARQIASGNTAEAGAFALGGGLGGGIGDELTKHLTPVQLVLLAALTGFVAGRRKP